MTDTFVKCHLKFDIDAVLQNHELDPVHLVCCNSPTPIAFCGKDCEEDDNPEEVEGGVNCWECVKIDLSAGGACPYGLTCPDYEDDEA